MFLALNILVFVLGFAVALISAARRSKNGRSELDSLLHKTQDVTDQLKSGHLVRAIKGTTSAGFECQYDHSQKQEASLLTKADVESHFEPSSWQRLAYEEFKAKILNKGSQKQFPCIYATMGYRSDDHRYVFLESDNPAEPRNLRLIAPAIKEYLQISTSLGPNTSLVIVGAPSESLKSVQQYNDSFWDMLRGLRIKDPQPWPADVPQDTDSEKWTFCFDGQALFPVMLTPAHQGRWSRQMPVPVIAMQPKWVLDNLLSTPEKRASATGKVRKLLADYDQVDISPDLTSYGQPGTSEVRQLCLMDRNETAQCPYRNFDE